MNNNCFDIYYIHKATKIVVNLCELRLLKENESIVVEKTLWDDVLNIDYNYINSYTKSQIIDCFDWDLVPILDNATKEQVNKYNLYRKYIDATVNSRYVGYDIRNNKSNQRQRSLY